MKVGRILQMSRSSEPQKLQRLTDAAANIYTDYALSEGRLKGLRVGGGLNYRGDRSLCHRCNDVGLGIKDIQRPHRGSAIAFAGFEGSRMVFEAL